MEDVKNTDGQVDSRSTSEPAARQTDLHTIVANQPFIRCAPLLHSKCAAVHPRKFEELQMLVNYWQMERTDGSFKRLLSSATIYCSSKIETMITLDTNNSLEQVLSKSVEY